jgi:hypothetical protein
VQRVHLLQGHTRVLHGGYFRRGTVRGLLPHLPQMRHHQSRVRPATTLALHGVRHAPAHAPLPAARRSRRTHRITPRSLSPAVRMLPAVQTQAGTGLATVDYLPHILYLLHAGASQLLQRSRVSRHAGVCLSPHSPLCSHVGRAESARGVASVRSRCVACSAGRA